MEQRSAKCGRRYRLEVILLWWATRFGRPEIVPGGGKAVLDGNRFGWYSAVIV